MKNNIACSGIKPSMNCQRLTCLFGRMGTFGFESIQGSERSNGFNLIYAYLWKSFFLFVLFIKLG